MSDGRVDDQAGYSAEAEWSVGQALRAAREARGESLADVAYALRLAQRQVEAMELEHFDELPGPTFVRGFVRNYAKYLGIDAEPLLGRLGGAPSAPVAPVAIESSGSHAIGTLPVREGRRGKPKLGAIVLGIAVLGGVAAYFDWFQVQDAPVAAVPATEGLVAPNTESITVPVQPSVLNTPAAEASATASVAPAEGSEATNAATSPAPVVDAVPVVPAGVSAEGAGNATASATATATASQSVATETTSAAAPDASSVSGSVSAPSPAAAASEAGAPANQAAVAASAAVGEGKQLLFSLRAESWIQVRDASGKTIYMGNGSAGSTRTVQGTPPFSLVVGNADNVSLEYEGRSVDMKPHTRNGGVARLTVE